MPRKEIEPKTRKRVQVDSSRSKSGRTIDVPREIGPIRKAVQGVGAIAITANFAAPAIDSGINFEQEALKQMRADASRATVVSIDNATSNQMNLPGGAQIDFSGRKLDLGQDETDNLTDEDDEDENTGGVEVAQAEVSQAQIEVAQQDAFNLLPDELKAQASAGIIEFNYEVRGYTRVVQGRLQVWRPGMSPFKVVNGIVTREYENVELGWVHIADTYVYNNEGQTVNFQFEVAASGLTDRKYQYLKLDPGFYERFPQFFEKYLKDTGLNGKRVIIQFAGDFNPKRENHDYMQIVLPSSNRDGTNDIAAQVDLQDNNTILIRVHTDSRVYSPDQLAFDEYYLSQLVTYAMVILQAKLYLRGIVDIDTAISIRSDSVNEMHRDLFVPLTIKPGETPMTYEEVLARRLVQVSKNPF